MSLVLKISYKQISHAESKVKNYANNKSIRDEKLSALYQEYGKVCAELIARRATELQADEYAKSLLRFLFGEQWMKTNGFEIPSAPQPLTLNDTLTNWLGINDDQSAEIERRYCGLWRIMRASSPPRSQASGRQFQAEDINYSLLNIRPRSLSKGRLCDFRLHYRGRHDEDDETREFSGFVIPNMDRLEFLGRLDGERKLMTLMMWRFAPNPEQTDHSHVANGIALSLNSDAMPIGAHIRAFFIEGSERLDGFDELRDSEKKRIGVHARQKLQNVIPQDHFDRTIEYLSEYEPIVGMHAARRNNPDA